MTGAEARHNRHAYRGGYRRAGFTLMEMIVVLGLFSTVIVAASDIFLLSNQAQRKVFSLERTQADARFTMEAITREVRSGVIDYAYYVARGAGIGTPDNELALIDGQGTAIRFHVSTAINEASCPDTESVPCLFVTLDASDPVPITPKGVKVRSGAFYIAPASDPSIFDPVSGTYATDMQPRVTVVLVLESVTTKVEDRARVQFQTTVSSRAYAR